MATTTTKVMMIGENPNGGTRKSGTRNPNATRTAMMM